MSGNHIQLSFGVVRDKSNKKSIKLNLPPNFRKDVLFDKLPYLSHLGNRAIVDVVKNGILDDLSRQKYLLATALLKDSIQDSLDRIVSSDGKLSDEVVRTQLHTKFPSVMRKPNPIDAVFKDKAKFDTQNLIIGRLLTQTESGKLNQIKKQLETAPSIKDLKIAEQSKVLRDFIQRKIDDYDNDDDNDDNDGNGHRPPRTPPPSPYDFLLYNSPLPSPLISDDDEIERTPAAGEKVAITEKVKFSEKLSKVFSEAVAIFNKNDHQKLSFDDAESLSKPDEITISQEQVIYKELNEGKLPE